MHPNLDLLRAVAVTLVFVSHLIMALGYWDHPISKLWGIRDLAMMGVLMFFIHTSLVLMMSLDRLGDENIIRRFYVRRAFRIYPLAIVAIAAALALKIPPHFEPVYESPSWTAILENALLVQNLFRTTAIVGPMWTLPLEMQMYLLLPFLYLIARRITSYAGVVVVIFSGFILWYVDRRISVALDSVALVPFAPWFFMGVAAYIGFRLLKPRFHSACFAAVLLGLTLAPMLVARFIGGLQGSYMIFLAGVIFALALPFFRDIGSSIIQKGAHTIATYSYGIYLAHVPVMYVAFYHLSAYPVWLQWSALVLLMLIVPPLTYHLIEEPLIGVGANLADRLRRPSPVNQPA
jgi:peptidoglycan/LPS O-acetylase OafA/YrhL